MGLFDLFKKSKNDTNGWETVLSKNLGKMLVIQHNAWEYVKDRDWWLEFRGGYIYFGDEKLPMQFIGSEYAGDNTWMWGWHNINQLPERLIRIAQQTQALGLKHNIKQLNTKKFCITDEVNGHNLSIVACGCAEENLFYHRCTNGETSVFVAVENAPKELFQPVDPARFVSTVTQAIAEYTIDHKLFAESFLDWNKTPYTWEGDTLIAHFPQKVCLDFETTQKQHYVIRHIRSETQE